MTTKLEFEATITKAVPVIAKEQGYGYGDNGRGELQLTLSLKQPAKPREPFNNYGNRARPEGLKRKAKEDDAAFADRSAQRNREIADWDSANAKYQAELAKYRLESQTYQARLMAYASLVGLTAAVFGSEPMVVTLVPLEQGLLPDYGVSLLSPVEPIDVTPAAVAEALQELVDDGVVIDATGSAPMAADVCVECGHQRAFHDDELPAVCSEFGDNNLPCECERGTTGW